MRASIKKINESVLASLELSSAVHVLGAPWAALR